LLRHRSADASAIKGFPTRKRQERQQVKCT